MEPNKKAAKHKVLSDLRDMAASMMKGDLDDHMKGMKKVTVASPDKEGLAMGLDKAKNMLHEAGEDQEDEAAEHEGMEGHDEDHIGGEANEASEDYVGDMKASGDGSEHDEGSETPSEEAHELKEMDMTPDEIDEMIRILQEKKSKHNPY